MNVIKKEWYTVKEFAEGVKSTPHALNQWFSIHPEFTEKYCKNLNETGKHKKWMIHWEALTAYMLVHNGKTANQYRLKDKLSRDSKEIKMNIADSTNEKFKNNQQNGLIAGVNFEGFFAELAKLSEQLKIISNQINQNIPQLPQSTENLMNRVDKIEKDLNAPLEPTHEQRAFLNDRVRFYCITNEIPFYKIWRLLNSHVGKGGVHAYNFAEYKKALAYLKALYLEVGLDWGI